MNSDSTLRFDLGLILVPSSFWFWIKEGLLRGAVWENLVRLLLELRVLFQSFLAFWLVAELAKR